MLEDLVMKAVCSSDRGIIKSTESRVVFIVEGEG